MEDKKTIDFETLKTLAPELTRHWKKKEDISIPLWGVKLSRDIETLEPDESGFVRHAPLDTSEVSTIFIGKNGDTFLLTVPSSKCKMEYLGKLVL
jgi:hypothetical protein